MRKLSIVLTAALALGCAATEPADPSDPAPSAEARPATAMFSSGHMDQALDGLIDALASHYPAGVPDLQVGPIQNRTRSRPASIDIGGLKTQIEARLLDAGIGVASRDGTSPADLILATELSSTHDRGEAVTVIRGTIAFKVVEVATREAQVATHVELTAEQPAKRQ